MTFSDLNMVKVKAADTKKKLEAAAVRYRRQKDTTRTCVSSLASKARHLQLCLRQTLTETLTPTEPSPA